MGPAVENLVTAKNRGQGLVGSRKGKDTQYPGQGQHAKKKNRGMTTTQGCRSSVIHLRYVCTSEARSGGEGGGEDESQWEKKNGENARSMPGDRIQEQGRRLSARGGQQTVCNIRIQRQLERKRGKSQMVWASSGKINLRLFT